MQLVWWAWPGMPKVPKITSLQYLCIFSRKRWGINVVFCPKINSSVFYKLVVSFLLVTARQAQSTQNSKFKISLQYVLRYEVDFLCRWASQLSTNSCYHFLWLWRCIPKVLKMISMPCLCNISGKNWAMKLMFCMLINMDILYKVIVLFLMGLARHAQITWVSLQCLCDILRKKSEMKLET